MLRVRSRFSGVGLTLPQTNMKPHISLSKKKANVFLGPLWGFGANSGQGRGVNLLIGWGMLLFPRSINLGSLHAKLLVSLYCRFQGWVAKDLELCQQ